MFLGYLVVGILKQKEINILGLDYMQQNLDTHNRYLLLNLKTDIKTR